MVSPPAPRRRPDGHARTIVVLGVGALGLAWSLTTTAAYLPPLLERFTGSTTLIALVLAAEGLFALTPPARDRPVERRLPHAARAPPAVHARRGRARSASASRCWRSCRASGRPPWSCARSSSPTTCTSRRIVGSTPTSCPRRSTAARRACNTSSAGSPSAGALVGGGFLFHLWEPAPFLLAAVVVTAACLVPIVFVREDGGHGRVFEGIRVYLRHSWRVLRRDRDVVKFLVANSAWEGTFAGARTFVVLVRDGRAGRVALDVEHRARRGRRRIHRRGARRRPAR